MASAPQPRPGGLLSAGLGFLVIAILFGAYVWSRNPNADSSPSDLLDNNGDSQSKGVKQESDPDDNVKLVRAARPPRPSEGYVGSASCTACHAEIAEMYKSHPMSLSLTPEPSDLPVEDYEHGTQFTPEGSRREYRVERKDGKVVHHELLVDNQGELVYDQAEPVAFAIGSGTRGCTYAINRKGILTASPISWFTNAAERKWDLSPGYSADIHPRFDRRVTEACMVCHAGRIATVPGLEDVFASTPVLEYAIGCERCHGPGDKHVALHQSGAEVALPDDSIVNPKHLQPRERESVCNQCHLQGVARIPRYGHKFADYRPGQAMEEIWTVFVSGETVKNDLSTTAVSHAEQMNGSVCAEQSNGRMGCTTCHDPHMSVAHKTHAEKSEFYRSRCLTCHADPDCTASPESRAKAENSCVDCHMPSLTANDVAHATQTDHRIQRIPKEGTANAASHKSAKKLAFFDGADQRMEKWEADRALGIAMIQSAEQEVLTQPKWFDKVEQLLVQALRVAPDDLPALETMSSVELGRKNHKAARQYLERMLRINPKHESALNTLVRICYDSADDKAGVRYANRLLAINPYARGAHARKSTMLGKLGDWYGAVAAARQGLEVDPTFSELRNWLITALKRTNQTEEVPRQKHLIEELQSRFPTEGQP